MAVSERDFMFGRKSVKVLPVDAVLPPRESKSNQVAFFNPPQDGYFTNAAMPGNGSGGEELRVEILQLSFQVIPPSRQYRGAIHNSGGYLLIDFEFLQFLTVFTRLTKFTIVLKLL